MIPILILLSYIVSVIGTIVVSIIYINQQTSSDDLALLLGVMLIFVAFVPVLNTIFTVGAIIMGIFKRYLQEKENKKYIK